ncbi:MAG: MFS transporter [Anaerolineales bacterium]|nr:MFS transporter [Anaerolineales bacterium]
MGNTTSGEELREEQSIQTSTDFETEVERNYRHNFTVNMLDGTTFWLGLSFMATRTILPLYVSHLTDSTLAIGLLAMIVSTGWLLPQLFTANWVQRLPVKKVIVVRVGLYAERLPVVLLILSAWLATRSQTLALVTFFIFLTWHVVGAGVIAVGWQDMMAKVFPTGRRGRFFGITNFGGTAPGILGAFAAVYVLDKYEFPYGYVICFAAAALFIFVSWIFVAQTREPAQVSKAEPISQREYLSSLPAILRGDPNFRLFMLSQIVVVLGGMAVGFLTVYAVQRWNLPDGQAAVFTISMLMGQAVSNLIFGWLADRKGHKLVLELSALCGALAVGVASIAPSPLWFYIVFALAGASAAGFILSGIMIVFEFCEPEIRPTYIGLNNSVMGVFAALTPLLGGWLAITVGYQALFVISFIIGLAGVALLRWTVREPRIAYQAESRLE